MYSVTSRINAIQIDPNLKHLKQPRYGYLPLKMFQEKTFVDKKGLFDRNCENVDASIVGLAVDYLTRYMSDNDSRTAFSISLRGAKFKNELENNGDIKIDKLGNINFIDNQQYFALITKQKSKNVFALFFNRIIKLPTKDKTLKLFNKFLKNVQGLDDNSIFNACRLAQYDAWYRAGGYFKTWKLIENINNETIENIRTMVVNSLNFFASEGKIIKHTLTFNDVNSNSQTTGGYSKVVSCGDADFLTPDGLWDLKVSINKPSSKDTLQILMYWIMGLHSKQSCYQNISKIGFFNPRLNYAWYINTKDIDPKLIKFVEDEIICYGKQ